jgi:cytochrome c-type biogenesis protein CcmE
MGRVFLSLVIGFTIIGALLVYQSTRATSSRVFEPSQLLEATGGADMQRLRVTGKVVEPINYQVEPALELRFGVQDRAGIGPIIPVSYRGVKPDMFQAGRDVLIDGDFKQGLLSASAVLTQCPSKYEPLTAPDEAK